MGLWQWSELSELMAKTCGGPQGAQVPCRNPKECAYCKVKEDDRSGNPLLEESSGWQYIPQGLLALIKLQEEKHWLVESPRETMQNLFNHSLEGNFSKSDKMCLQNWGFVLLKQDQSTFIRGNLALCAFVEHEVIVDNQMVHMFSIQHDPGNDKYAYMAGEIWNISFAGYTKPNACSIGNVIETLLSLWCLAPSFPDLIGRLGLDLIKKHMRAWEDDLLSRNPQVQPKVKIVIKQEQLDQAGLLAPVSDDDEFLDLQDPQEAPSAAGERKRPVEDEKDEGCTHVPRTRRRTQEPDMMEAVPALAGALLGVVQTLKETLVRIENIVTKQVQESGTPLDHPDCIQMERMVTEGFGYKAPAQTKDDTYDPKWFPVVAVEEGMLPSALGEEVLREPDAFRQWAMEQDAAILGQRADQVTPEEWASIKSKMIGHLNVGRLRQFQGTKEFWAPLGEVEKIVGEHQKWGNRPLPRDVIVKYLTNALRKDGDELTHQPAYQVLKLDTTKGDLYFWRANKGADWYHMHMDEGKVAERLATRANRASWYNPKKAAVPTQGGRSNYQWGSDQPEGSDTYTQRQGQGNKCFYSWGQGNQEDQSEYPTPYPQGGKGNWAKHSSGEHQGGGGAAPADAWKDYQGTRGSSDYQEREGPKAEGQASYRGWKKGW